MALLMCVANKTSCSQCKLWHAFAERPGTVLIRLSLYCCCCEIASVCVCLILKAIETTCTDLKGGLDGSQPNQPSLLFVTLSLCLPQQLLHNLLGCCMACACDMICTCCDWRKVLALKYKLATASSTQKTVGASPAGLIWQHPGVPLLVSI